RLGAEGARVRGVEVPFQDDVRTGRDSKRLDELPDPLKARVIHGGDSLDDTTRFHPPDRMIGQRLFFARLSACSIRRSCAEAGCSPGAGATRLQVPSEPSSHAKRVSVSSASSTPAMRAGGAGSSTGASTGPGGSGFRGIGSALPIHVETRSPAWNDMILLCSRNGPSTLRTVIRSLSPGTPGLSTQMPRVIASTVAPAADA